MVTKTYKMLDLIGTSDKSVEDAINSAVALAAKTVRHIDWFEVKELRGSIADGKVAQFQVKFQIGFRLEE